MPQHPSELRIADFSYSLPDDRIALKPAEPRDSSKLLCYKKGQIVDSVFNHLPNLLPTNSLLVLNETRVMPARLLFQKQTGAVIEIFCLNALNSSNPMLWHCMLGNVKKWNQDEVLELIDHQSGSYLHAKLIERNGSEGTVLFETNHKNAVHGFPEVLEQFGHIPLPPYIKRADNAEDRIQYQTVFAKVQGSVAAPTASLHFTDEVLNNMLGKGHSLTRLVLHVGAGTFLPVKSANMAGHTMHQEQIWIPKESIRQIKDHQGPIIPVGTTSARTLETLYWCGVKLHLKMELNSNELIGQWEAYDLPHSISREVALDAVLNWLEENQYQGLNGETSILLAPPYQWKLGDGLVTNFHQPESTLLLLVASLIGDSWKEIYSHALQNNYRFLSYGDSSFLQA